MTQAPRAATRRFLRLLVQALNLAFWRRPKTAPELSGFGSFLASSALALLAFAVQDYNSTQSPAEFFSDGFHVHASYFLTLLIAAWLATQLLQRPALWMLLSALAVLIGIPWTAISLYANDRLADAGNLQLYAWRALLAMAGFVALFRTIGFVASASPPARRACASLLFVLLLAWPWYGQQRAWFWYPPENAEQPPEPVPVPGKVLAPLAPSFDPRLILARQPLLVQQSIEAVRAQTPGTIDLFSIGFAGDGSQKVFRNEVEYFDRLMANRFNAAQRTVALINAPETVNQIPLASLSNLRTALAGVAARMDTSEDLLVLFLTSHGSEDHQLLVSLEPLPLRQIRPGDLRAALDDAGIRWRVVIVSACYSGGFIDALRDPDTLVITAARSDRTSFGCGSDSKITWFGRAFLTQALNKTIDFEHGFDLANKQIREWELAQGETPSVPQLAGGWAIRRQLAAWRRTQPTGPAIAFYPRDDQATPGLK